jgi:hypothetical protein
MVVTDQCKLDKSRKEEEGASNDSELDCS